MDFKLVGMDKLQRLLIAGSSEAAKAAGRGLYGEAQEAFDASQDMVPVDTAALIGSGMISEPMWEGDKMTVELGYGGPAAPYAIYVHEDLEANHMPGKEAKYLEKPVVQQTQGMDRRLASYIENELRDAL